MAENTKKVQVLECFDLPENPNSSVAYKLLPKNPDENYYNERTDRNIGWITREEQKILKNMTVGIAGCGGMGGLLAAQLLRMGIGEIRITDIECFDISNLNRQAAATKQTIGKSKAFSTARLLRDIADDSIITIYPQGISEKTAQDFIAGCDVICDEIEFFAVDARILLHMVARINGVSILNGNTIGFGTRLFFFTPDSGTMEECLDMSYQEAVQIVKDLRIEGKAKDARNRIINSIIKGLSPELPEYRRNDKIKNLPIFHERLGKEGKAPIIATNPPLATGFLADHTLLYLLKKNGITLDVVYPPKMPGYLYFDLGGGFKVVTGKWW